MVRRPPRSTRTDTLVPSTTLFRSARGLDQTGVLIAPLGPGDAKAVLRGPDHARYIDRDLDLAALGEGIIVSRMIVERLRAGGRGEIISGKPVLAQDERAGRGRSEERRVGQECGSTCRSRWWSEHKTNIYRYTGRTQDVQPLQRNSESP